MLRVQRDHLAGLIVMAMGFGIAALGSRYGLGTMKHVGPGFLPVVLGVLQILVGATIALNAAPSEQEDGNETEIHGSPDLRGWSCIVGSVILFVGLAKYAGFIPAIFACVFTAALGDRSARLLHTALLAAGMTACGVVVFSYGLGIQIPLLRGFNG